MIGEMSQKEIETLLHDQVYGHLGCHAGGEVYVVPATFVYHENAIYSYTHEGKKISMMREDPEVCFEVEEIKSGNEWKSVIMWGVFEELQNADQQKEAEMLLAQRFSEMNEKGFRIKSPLIVDIGSHEKNELQKPTVYRIRIEKMTGRFEKP